MDKELLQKIYNLRKIKPDSGFVLSTRKSIIESTQQNELKNSTVLQNPFFNFNTAKEVFNYLTVPVNYNSKLVLSTSFIFLLAFTFFTLSSFPVSNDYNKYNNFQRFTPQEIVLEIEDEDTDEELKLVAEDKNNTDTIVLEKPVERQLTALEGNLRKVQKEVLGTIIKETPDQELTDKEIADRLATGIEKTKPNQEIGVMQLETTDVKGKPELLEEAMKVYEAEDYEEFIHTVIDILNTKELLDILSE